jgi:hypothetical protein
MSETASIAERRNRRPLAIVAGVSGLVLAATTLLWIYYGTAVFYEMILAGIAMCF